MFFPRTFIISVLMGLVLCTLASAIHVDVSNSTCNGETNRFPTPNFNRAMLQEHNKLRKQHELRPLKWDKKLQTSAQDDASRCHVEQPVDITQTHYSRSVADLSNRSLKAKAPVSRGWVSSTRFNSLIPWEGLILTTLRRW